MQQETYPDIRNDIGIVAYGWKVVLEVDPHKVKVGEVREGDGGDEEEDKGKKEEDDSGDVERARLEVDGHVDFFLSLYEM